MAKKLQKNGHKIDGYTLILISDLAAITPENYDKFFSKI